MLKFVKERHRMLIAGGILLFVSYVLGESVVTEELKLGATLGLLCLWVHVIAEDNRNRENQKQKESLAN